MNKKQSKFLSMCLTLSRFYEKYKTEIQANAIISRLFDELFSILGEMEEAIQAQKGYTSEASAMKQKEEDEMLEAVCRNAAKGYVYAEEKKLPGLLETLRVSSWQLQKLGDIQLHTACLNIYHALKEITPEAIAEYGIEASDLTTLKKEIDDFYALISVPRSKIITRSQATAKIEAAMKQIQTLLSGRLDKMVFALPDSLQIMKNEYKAARVIMYRSSGNDDDTTTEQPKT